MSSVTLPNMLVASSVGQGVQSPANPLAMASGAEALQGQMLQNQQQKNEIQNFQAQKAAGQDFQQAIGPDGQVDPDKFGKIVAQDPTAALQAIQQSHNVLANVNTALANKGITLNQALQRQKFIADSTGALLTNGQPIQRKDVLGAVADGINAGILSPKEAGAIAASVPSDPTAIKPWLQQQYTGAQGTLNAIVPHLLVANAGNHLLFPNVNPLSANSVPSGATVPLGLSPGEATSPVTYPGAQGQPVTTTRAAIADAGGLPSGANTGATPAVGGLTPEQQSAESTYGQQTGAMGANVVASASNLSQQRAALSGVLDQIDSANPGPLANTFQKIGGVIGQLGIANLTTTSATQLMKKGSAQLVVSQVGSGLGVPTDGKMEEVINSIPNISMTPLAAKGAGAQIAGIIDYRQSQSDAWTKYEQVNGPTSYPEFQAQWNKDYPTAAVFQFGGLPKVIQGQYWNSLSPAQKTQFAESYQKGVASGYLQPMTNAK